ncbi:MAG: polysaccharide biosynthesis tyrosine autokinase, partial [Paludibacteraceae bacterium]|nr:polysaccharide biosynthesis tyrosine autokinase [Paludibacteraceae bacterium]
VDEFMNRLSFNFVSEGSSVLGISLTSETPQRDCEFIDKLAEIYLQKSLEQKNEVAEKSIHFINDQLVNLQDALEHSESAMTNFRQANKFVDVNSYAGQLMGRVASYDEQALALRLRETYFDYLTKYLSTNIENGAVIAPATLGLNDPTLMALVQQLNDLRIQRGELTDRNVYYAKYTNDIENVKTAISEVVSSMRASLKIEKADLERRYEEVETEIKSLPEKELQMVAIERNYRIDDNYYTFFLQKRAEAEIQKASNTPDNTVLDKARTISIMNATAKKKTMSTYLIIGFLIPLVLIILSEVLNNKIRSPKDVVKLKMFRLIGSVRHARNQNPTLVRARPKSSYAEMLRSIRTRIEFVVKRKENLLLTVSSTESGDGKTFLCSNLAALYSMTGKKTLLVDADIRKPNLHTKLGLEDGLGLTNYLIGDCELDDIIVTDTPFGFDLMLAGTVPPNPGELIHSDKMAEMLQNLRERYSYIIIDTSPIGLVPDAYPLIDQSDLCLFVVRCMQTDKGLCKLTLEQMAEVVENQEKVQIVLSDIPIEGRFSYGGYGYGYGYGYGGYGYGYGGYGYGAYGYGKRRRSRFSKRNQDAINTYNYYHDDEEEEDNAETETNSKK